MTDHATHDPMIYFTRENGKLGLCLSYLGKWLAGIAAAIITAGTLAFFGLVYASERNSAMALLEIKQMRGEFTEYKGATDKRFERLENRMDKDDADDRRAHSGGGSK